MFNKFEFNFCISIQILINTFGFNVRIVWWISFSWFLSSKFIQTINTFSKISPKINWKLQIKWTHKSIAWLEKKMNKIKLIPNSRIFNQKEKKGLSNKKTPSLITNSQSFWIHNRILWFTKCVIFQTKNLNDVNKKFFIFIGHILFSNIKSLIITVRARF